MDINGHNMGVLWNSKALPPIYHVMDGLYHLILGVLKESKYSWTDYII